MQLEIDAFASIARNSGGLCIESVDGSVVSDVTVKGLKMNQVAQPLFIRLAGRLAKYKSPTSQSVGSIVGVLIEGLHSVNPHAQTKLSCSITGDVTSVI